MTDRFDSKEAFSSILSRRSIRRFKPDPIAKETLDQILTAGTYAPTGMNRQSPIILTVTNKDLRDRLSRLNAQIMGTDGDPFYGAPVVLIVLAKKSCPTHVYDGSLVMGNLLNAAHAVGLGSCWIQGRLRQAENGTSTEAFCRTLLSVPARYTLEAILSLGFPAIQPEAHSLEDLPREKIHWDTF